MTSLVQEWNIWEAPKSLNNSSLIQFVKWNKANATPFGDLHLAALLQTWVVMVCLLKCRYSFQHTRRGAMPSLRMHKTPRLGAVALHHWLSVVSLAGSAKLEMGREEWGQPCRAQWRAPRIVFLTPPPPNKNEQTSSFKYYSHRSNFCNGCSCCLH